jgi:hypothetical protein
MNQKKGRKVKSNKIAEAPNWRFFSPDRFLRWPSSFQRLMAKSKNLASKPSKLMNRIRTVQGRKGKDS